MQDAMVLVLRTVHKHFGVRPEVGKFFRAGDSHSMAAFFRIGMPSAGGPSAHVSGLAIVSTPAGSQPAAAVLVDDSSRFGKTGPIMMKRLGEAWRADSAKASRQAPAGAAGSTLPEGSGRPRQLHAATAGDRSASIGLPEGWRLTGVTHGRLSAEGPNGETINRGIILHGIHDQAPRNGGRMRGPPPLVYPRDGDLFQAFVSVTNQIRGGERMAPATYKLVRSAVAPHSPYEARAIQADFEVDFRDGKGLRTGKARVGVMYTRGFPMWQMNIDTWTVPKTVAAAEEPTMLAITRSYSQNSKVIMDEAHAAVDKIHQDGKATQAQSTPT